MILVFDAAKISNFLYNAWYYTKWFDLKWYDRIWDDMMLRPMKNVLKNYANTRVSFCLYCRITRCIIIYRRLLQHHGRCDYSGTRQWENFSIDNSNNKICSGKTSHCSRRWCNCDLQLCICNVRWALKHQFLWQQGDNTFVHEWIV